LIRHEKWDGTGYPGKLAGNDIPLVGRNIANADIFDALTSERPYKDAWSVDKAIDSMRGEKGKHFNPKLFQVFPDVMTEVLKIKQSWAA